MTRKFFYWFKWKVIHLLIRLNIVEDESPKDYYVSKVSRNAPWVYISYISDVFYHLNDERYLNTHQNKREAILMVSLLNQLGYSVYVQNYTSTNPVPKLKNVKIIFGHEPKMVEASLLYPNAHKIYYATGAYGEHQNNQVIKMTDKINAKYNANIPYRRLTDVDAMKYAYEIADKILLIGSRYTIQTFPVKFHHKITTIKQSTQVSSLDIKNTDYGKDFLFLGSYGNMLKGLPLIFDYFITNTDKVVHVIGSIEEDYFSLVEDSLTPNIKIYGYLDLQSPIYLSILKQCNFIVYPSGSEGIPGAVLNPMKYGVIPIVTPWAAFDGIESYGYLISSWDVKGLSKGIEWAMSLSKEEILKKKKECSDFVKNNFSLEQFSKEFVSYFESLDNV